MLIGPLRQADTRLLTYKNAHLFSILWKGKKTDRIYIVFSEQKKPYFFRACKRPLGFFKRSLGFFPLFRFFGNQGQNRKIF